VPLKIMFEFLGYDCLCAGYIYTIREFKCDRYPVILFLEIILCNFVFRDYLFSGATPSTSHNTCFPVWTL